MKKEIPVPIITAALVVVLVVCGVFLFRAITGGKQGDGKEGNIAASPPGQQRMAQQKAAPSPNQ